MARPVRLQLQRKNEQMELTVRIQQRTGVRGTDADGGAKPQKARFLRSVSVQLNSKTVVDAQVGPSVADNPHFSFIFANVQAGDKFAVLCTDDAGDEITGEILVEA